MVEFYIQEQYVIMTILDTRFRELFTSDTKPK